MTDPVADLTVDRLFPTVVETERLWLERLDAQSVDAREFYGTFWTTDHADAVFEHVPQGRHAHPMETREFVEEAAEHLQEGEGGQWLVRPKASEDGGGRPAGVCSLIPEWELDRARIGLLLDRPYWGRGYSQERAAAVLSVAFDHLGLAVVTVDHTVDNDNSRRAVRKYVDRFGGQRDGVVRNHQPREDRVDDVAKYSITHEQWTDNRPDGQYPILHAEIPEELDP